VGDTQALERFNELWRTVLAPRGCKLVYNTGRSLADYKALREDWDLLVPDAFIGGCGTQVYTFDAKGCEEQVLDWVEHLSSGWDKTRLVSEILSDSTLQERFGSIREKVESQGNELLFSMRLPAVSGMDTERVKQDILAAISCKAEDVRISVASVSFKGKTTVTGFDDIDVSGADGCLFVDVMPQAAGKGHALTYVREKLFSMSESQCIVAGDSGNDCTMFEGEVERGIMVGNAKPELLAIRKDSHHVSNDKYAAGLVQGLQHYGVLESS